MSPVRYIKLPLALFRAFYKITGMYSAFLLLAAALVTMQVAAPTTRLTALFTNKNTAFRNLHFIHHAPLGFFEKKAVKLMPIQVDFIIKPQHTKSLAKAMQTYFTYDL